MTKAVAKILDDIVNETLRQDEKWGADRTIAHVYPGAKSKDGVLAAHHLLSANTYKAAVELDRNNNRCSWAGILMEEVAEAIEEAADNDTIALREELIQIAALIVQWVKQIDRESKNGVG